MRSTVSTIPLKPEHANRITRIPIVSERFTLRRILFGYAYPANGNVGNPTPKYYWLLMVDGNRVDSADNKGDLVRAAQNFGNVYLEEVDERNAMA